MKFYTLPNIKGFLYLRMFKSVFINTQKYFLIFLQMHFPYILLRSELFTRQAFGMFSECILTLTFSSCFGHRKSCLVSVPLKFLDVGIVASVWGREASPIRSSEEHPADKRA